MNDRLPHLRPHPSAKLGRVLMSAKFSARPTQPFCAQGYVIALRRADGEPITDHEVQVLVHELLDGFSGRPTSINNIVIAMKEFP